MNAAVLTLEPDAVVWRDVAALADVPLRGARRVRTAAGDVAIFRTGTGEIFALLDRCPHKRGPLSQGIVHGSAVTCPLHAWVIDLASGQPQGADAGKGCVPVVAVKAEGGRILLADPGEGGPV
ncbi:nitrite reductase (NAD(P)H) small subunit [Phenylobacterium sp.]|uniref:nitrite reductase (NAD(P)H) small subunit n=1 Tax=Phenylobacterium sp. TaxID=1871053 RepID=UPI0019832FB0|nr:nitrite reductase (NAD(P)H) small subunit [Phenylobacterium sp.]MBC7165967.1 nitrite reductase (NAD(P)H) small subunit [Phenylobacterium sp.]